MTDVLPFSLAFTTKRNAFADYEATIDAKGSLKVDPEFLKVRDITVLIKTSSPRGANKAQRNTMYRVMVAALKQNPFVDIIFHGGCCSPWKKAEPIDLADRRRQ